MDKSLMSAKFKKDYIAHLAIGIFFFILGAELILAILLPIHLRSENVLVLQVSRQDMIDSFDGLRRGFLQIKKTGQLEGEAGIICKSLDSLALYLRKYQSVLTATQIAEIGGELADFEPILNRMQQGKSFARQDRINPADFLKQLSAEGMKPVSD